MVLNCEETRDSIQFSNESPGYLVCSGCDGFYELQGDETPEEFDKCECGSPLLYYKTREEFENSLKSSFNGHLEAVKSRKSIVEEPSPEKTPEKTSVKESSVEEEISKNKNSEKVKGVKKPSTSEPSPENIKTTAHGNKVPGSNKSAVDRLFPQKKVPYDVLTNLKQEGADLWDNLDELNSKHNHQPPQASADHTIELDRLMVMVDHQRTFKENEKGFTSESNQGKSPILIIGIVIVLIVVVLALTMTLGIF